MADRKILIVDDEADLPDILETAFDLIHWDVITAANGADALEIVKSQKNLAALISDVRMPIMDGLELLKQIKSSGITIPQIYLLTGYSNISSKEAQDLGARELLHKPFDPITLSEQIEKEFCAKI